MKKTTKIASWLIGAIAMAAPACTSEVEPTEDTSVAEEGMIASPFLYEHSASRPLADGESPSEAVNETVELLKNEITRAPGMSLVHGLEGKDQVEFPPIDYDMDGTPDAHGAAVEIAFAGDRFFTLDLGRSFGVPWVIGIYAQYGQVYVDLGVPETFTSLYFQGSPHLPTYYAMAGRRHWMMRVMVHHALWRDGFTTLQDEGIEGTEMPQWRIAEIAEATGVDVNTGTRTLTLPPGHTITEVRTALEEAFAQSASGATTPDLDQDGTVGEELPESFQAYLQGQMTCDDMHQSMSQAMGLWEQGGTFQPWKSVRTLDQHPFGPRNSFVIEVCQGFYASMALTSGIHHLSAMPCNVGVWEKNGRVTVSILDANFIFSYFFVDAQMPEPMMKLFGMFPTTVYNEMAAVTNNALASLGETSRFELQPIPNTCH